MREDCLMPRPAFAMGIVGQAQIKTPNRNDLGFMDIENINGPGQT